MENTREEDMRDRDMVDKFALFPIFISLRLIQGSGPQENANKPMLNLANAHTEGITTIRDGLQSLGTL